MSLAFALAWVATVLASPQAHGAWGVAYAPVDVTAPRPALVFLHGMWAGPEDACPLLRDAVARFGFLVCPRGNTPFDAGVMWSGTGADAAGPVRAPRCKRSRRSSTRAACRRALSAWAPAGTRSLLTCRRACATRSHGCAARTGRRARGSDRSRLRIRRPDSPHDGAELLGWCCVDCGAVASLVVEGAPVFRRCRVLQQRS
jgi:hypothetical protein